ncbi:MAG TPA: HNH endonuclease signature motif containing protein [Phycisphaerae bacterium]|nr:HNH endonuclease signature motif containing protein [Phycisphaerae bacterium]
MPVRPKTRFDVFKRDSFTCRYCGKTSPDVVLEIDHIVPLCEGGTDDEINLATSCWECNRGKTGEPLSVVMDGEDPHDRAVMLLERERQLREYNSVLAEIRERRDMVAESLLDFWCESACVDSVPKRQFAWLKNELERTPAEVIRGAMDIAINYGMTRDWRYVMGIIKRHREPADA